MRKHSSGTLIRMRVIMEIVNANSETNGSILKRTIYETTDSQGTFVFKQKGKVAKELLERLFDHDFFRGTLQVIVIAMNYDWDRLGTNIETDVVDEGDSIAIKFKKKR